MPQGWKAMSLALIRMGFLAIAASYVIPADSVESNQAAIGRKVFMIEETY